MRSTSAEWTGRAYMSGSSLRFQSKSVSAWARKSEATTCKTCQMLCMRVERTMYGQQCRKMRRRR